MLDQKNEKSWLGPRESIRPKSFQKPFPFTLSRDEMESVLNNLANKLWRQDLGKTGLEVSILGGDVPPTPPATLLTQEELESVLGTIVDDFWNSEK